MSILVFQHVATEGPALLGAALQRDGHRLRPIRLFAGEPVPADLDDVDAVLSMGGPMNVEDAATLPWLAAEIGYLRQAHVAGVPIVGVCLGAQLIAAALGGQVAAMAAPEVGWGPIKQSYLGTTDPILAGLPWATTVFHLHGQQVTQLPPDAGLLASSPACKVQAFRVGLTTYAFQYHFEWGRSDLEAMARDGLVTKAGATAEAILAQSDQHYGTYRRLGDRLCRNLADYLLPLEKLRTRQRERLGEKAERGARGTVASQP